MHFGNKVVFDLLEMNDQLIIFVACWNLLRVEEFKKDYQAIAVKTLDLPGQIYFRAFLLRNKVNF